MYIPRRAGKALTVLVLVASSAGASATGALTFTCHSVPLEATIEYSASAVWSRDGATLWIADSRKGKLYQVTAAGRLLQSVARPGWGPYEFQRPIALTPTESGYLLNDRARHFIWFDDQLKPLRALDFRPRTPQRDFSGYIALFDLAVMGDELVGYGVLQTPDEEKASEGYFRLQTEPTVEVLDRIEEIPPTSLTDQYVPPNLPVIARTTDAVWGLVYAEPPTILRLTPPYRQLQSFPPGFETLPELPIVNSPQTGPIHILATEQSTLPTALYGDGDYLYLVTRRAQPIGKTVWQLHQIDPRKDRLLRTLTLPTDAKHLVLAPGAERWAVLEKESQSERYTQPIPSMLLLPARWITDPEATQDDLALPCH